MDCYETLDNPQVEDPYMRMQYNNGVVKMKSPRSQRRGKVDTLWFDQIPIDRQTRRRAGKSGPSLRNMSCSAAIYQWELTVRSFDKNVLVREHCCPSRRKCEIQISVNPDLRETLPQYEGIPFRSQINMLSHFHCNIGSLHHRDLNSEM